MKNAFFLTVFTLILGTEVASAACACDRSPDSKGYIYLTKLNGNQSSTIAKYYCGKPMTQACSEAYATCLDDRRNKFADECGGFDSETPELE